ncbi:family 16 glycosylhydrolase [Aestuariivivens sediminis]|uniref:family 16 glycosylhydrolase n=1 Tax=Aestuariivivens sediminis TaxID=2913557 RepID=UPI003B8A872C
MEIRFIIDFNKKYKAREWHISGFLWTSEYAVWFIDGKEVRRLDAKGIVDWPSKNMYLVLNNGTRSESPEGITKWQNYLRIDNIKLFTK